MSPILLRPIREQLEHDRVIRQLQTRWRRRFEAGINVGNEETVSVRSGDRTCFPDLVLASTAGGRRLHGVIEVETAESVNHLEAMSEWSHFAKARGLFYLYVPAGFTEVALRLCQATKINVTEIWAYYAIDSQAKFSMAYRSPRAKQQIRAASVKSAKSAKKPASMAKKPKASKSSAKPARARKKAVKVSKTKKAGKATRRAPAKQTAPKKATKKKVTKKKATKKKATKKKATKKKATKKTQSTTRGRRAGKSSAPGATKRSSKRSSTAKRKA